MSLALYFSSIFSILPHTSPPCHKFFLNFQQTIADGAPFLLPHKLSLLDSILPVSYTHLDVYKRQPQCIYSDISIRVHNHYEF